MAGGDLDGDIFFICWDQALISHLSPEKMEAPANYSKPTLLTQAPRSDNIADHFVFYLERDVLGKIANLHLALCD